MKGHIKFEATDYGLQVDVHIKDVGFFDRVMLLNAMMTTLDIDMSDSKEVATYCGLASTVGNKAATKISVDGNMLNALKDLKGKQDAEEG